MFKRTLVLLVCVICALTMVSQVSFAEPKENVVIGVSLDITLIDPQGSNLIGAMILFTLTHETLTEVDNAGIVHDGLAHIEQLDDVTYKFTIPADVTFTNGEPCTTEDIAFTFDRARESSFTSSKIVSLDHTEILSPTEILFVLTAPNGDFPLLLSHKGLSILSKKAVEVDPDNGPSIGTGRYYLTKWVPGNETIVERNEGYHGKKGISKTITFRHIAENSARIIALQNREIDIALNLDVLDMPTIEEDSALEAIRVENIQALYLAFNVNKAPFDNIQVRKAIAHAVNKENVIIAASNGEGKVHNSIVNNTQFALDETIPAYEYDPELAKSMLAAAGYPNGLDITLTCYKGAPYETIAAVVQYDMAEAGINININPVEPAAQKAMMKEGEHEMVIYGWTDAMGTDNTLRALLYSTSGSNRCKIADPDLDKMIDDALVEMDIAKREQKYKDIQWYVNDLTPYIMLYTGYIYAGVRAGTTGIEWIPSLMHNFNYVSVPAE